MKKSDELAGRTGLTFGMSYAPEGQGGFLCGGPSVLERAMGTTSGAFEAVAGKLGRRLVFRRLDHVELIDYMHPGRRYEKAVGSMEGLETVVRDEGSGSEDKWVGQEFGSD